LFMAERDWLRSLRFERSAAPQTAKGRPEGVRILAQPKNESIPNDEFKNNDNPKHKNQEAFSTKTSTQLNQPTSETTYHQVA